MHNIGQEVREGAKDAAIHGSSRNLSPAACDEGRRDPAWVSGWVRVEDRDRAGLAHARDDVPLGAQLRLGVDHD